MKTPRLNLRRFNLNDFANMRELEANPDVMCNSPHRFPLTDERIQERLQAMINNEPSRAPLGIWAAELTEGSDFVGWFMLLQRDLPFVELGFMIVQRHWGQGYTAEACQRLIHLALVELNYPGLSAVTDAENNQSIRVLQKSGFGFVKQYSQFDKVLQKDVLLNLYELTRDSYQSRHQ
ncbi:GNAT family N-acetyltransferase [Bdellovibrio sp. KM01]|uniref:GNAT family N-acetyltransferase n=1 Tax=Bdellovibrio sp. KM01 TaxID=2748865 RepID=UPI0015EAC65D|nr:GNAT family N-acetyltransferase [Bdellovibrio sp. KM01]QLY26951.1 GNAT family N-acetyltransferase [Bdellovibrio sp. KM01]